MNPYYASDPRAWAFFAIATMLTLMVLIPYITIQLNAFVVGYRLQCKLRPREFFVPAACLLAGQAQRRRVRKILENRLVPETTLRDISRQAALEDQHVTARLYRRPPEPFRWPASCPLGDGYHTAADPAVVRLQQRAESMGDYGSQQEVQALIHSKLEQR